MWRAFIPISSAIGPETIAHSAEPPVLVNAEWALYRGSSIASIPASTTGKYSGRQPARTAFDAACSTLTAIPRSATAPSSSDRISPGAGHHRLDPLGRRFHHRQAVGPAEFVQLLLDVGGLHFEERHRAIVASCDQPVKAAGPVARDSVC